MAKEFFRATHDFHKTNGTDTAIRFDDPSLTRQEFAEECDINSLMKRYEVYGGTINGLPSNAAPMYIDFAELPDTLMGYLEFMDNAQAAFMTLPAAVRKEFDNSAHMFVDFASDPENLETMRKWGLAAPAPVVQEEPKAPPPSPEPPKGEAPPKAS